MKCTFSELRSREVINVATGARIGYIDDVRLDTQSLRVDSLIIYGRPRLFGLLGREEDVVVRGTDIVMIGSDTVLIRNNNDDLFDMHKNSKDNLFD
ncbi:MAG: YlmC/YmxH family sporulation protein [Huintestinicola sp.]